MPRKDKIMASLKHQNNALRIQINHIKQEHEQQIAALRKEYYILERERDFYQSALIKKCNDCELEDPTYDDCADCQKPKEPKPKAAKKKVIKKPTKKKRGRPKKNA